MTAEVRTCPECGVTFWTSGGKGIGRKRVYCSEHCQWRKNNHARAAKKVPASRVCKQCEQSFMPRSINPQQAYCSAGCQKKHNLGPDQRNYTCITCGRGWTKGRYDRSGSTKQCEACVDNRPTRTHMRHRFKILERDSWVCQICFIAINRAVTHPHPWSASVDHIRPLSLGGSNAPDNLRAAHLRCNQKRGARLDPPVVGAERIT